MSRISTTSQSEAAAIVSDFTSGRLKSDPELEDAIAAALDKSFREGMDYQEMALRLRNALSTPEAKKGG